jgi:hypothetical protein
VLGNGVFSAVLIKKDDEPVAKAVRVKKVA